MTRFKCLFIFFLDVSVLWSRLTALFLAPWYAPPVTRAPSMAFAIDATKYAEAKVPEWSLRQVFADSKLPESLRRAVADHDILTLEVFSNLGDDMKSFKEAMCKVLTEEELGTGGKQVVHLASLTTCWKRPSTQIVNQETQLVRLREDPLKIPEIPEMEYGEYRIAFMKRHPDIPLADHKEPNKR